MLNKSIAYRLSIYISSAVIGVFIIFMIIFYTINSRNINRNITNKAIGDSNHVIRQIEKQLVSTREITSNISDQIIFYGQHDHPELFITNLLKRYPYINAIHINIDSIVPALNYHNYYAFQGEDKVHFQKGNERIFNCLNEKRIITDISQTQKPGWTEVFTCKRNENLVISFYSPIVINKGNKKQIVGEVITELSLLELNEIINAQKFEDSGYSFLVSPDGTYLTHPIKRYIFSSSIFSLSDDVYNKEKTDMHKVLEEGLSGSLIAFTGDGNNEKQWVYYTRISETNWTLIFVKPYTELFSELYISLLKMILIAVVGILIIFVIITYLTNRLVEPLSAVTAKLKRFADLTEEGDLNTMDEVQMVSKSLNNFRIWYKKYKIHQSEEEKKNQRQMQDLLQASEIQQGLINTAFSDFSEIEVVDVHGLYKPARIVSGDLFDFFFLDEDNLIFTMGDVSGKGVPAAFFMSIAQTIIKSKAGSYKGASEIVTKANNELYTNNKHQFFLTLFIGILNIKTGILEYCNAAHTPSYILKPNGKIVELNQSHGLPLGLYSNRFYSDSQINVEKGDTIVLYTDGVTELQNENKELFGNQRFADNLQNLIGSEPEKIVDRIDKSLKSFKGETPQVDDITLMAIKYNT